MRMKLTKEFLAKLAVCGEDKIVWDTVAVGMGVRVRASGHMTYVVQYRAGSGRASKSVRISLDDVASVSLDDARKAAKALLGSVALGSDPRQERRAENSASSRLVCNVIDEYERDLERRQVTMRHKTNTVSVLRRGLKRFLAKDLADLTLRDFIRAIEEAGRPGAQQSLRQRLTPMLNFAMNVGLINFNVMAGWRRPRSSKMMMLSKPGRTLSKSELAAIWRSTSASGSFNWFVRFMMLTGLRNNEAASFQWRWIDHAKGAIVIPAFRMKSGRAHSIPLTQQIQDLIHGVPRVLGTNLVFPTVSKEHGWTTMSGFGQMLVKLQKQSDTTGWTLYDLRRTYRSLLADFGYDLDLCERMIAHSRGGLVERYDRSTRWDARVDAASVVAKFIVSNAEEFEKSASGAAA